MNKLLTALILSAITVTAQAGDISLECDYIGGGGESKTKSLVFDPQAGTGMFGKSILISRPVGNTYVLTDKVLGPLGGTFTLNRETLNLKIEAMGNSFFGQCKVAQSNNKI